MQAPPSATPQHPIAAPLFQKRGYGMLAPLAAIYGGVMTLRNKAFNCGLLPTKKADVPVISVGNLAVGGTGKTPHVDYLIHLLQPAFRLGVLSRGYGRTTRGFRLVSAEDDASTVGDEPLQLKLHHPDVVVAVDENRVNGATRLQETDRPPQLLLLDDAYQHRYIFRDINILLTDYSRLYPLDRVLPAGRLREPISGSRRADMILVTKCPDSLTVAQADTIRTLLSPQPEQGLYFTTMTYGAPYALFTEQAVPSLTDKALLVVSGIAHPAPLLHHLSAQGAQVKSLNYPDHHRFSVRDAEHINRAFEDLPGKEKWAITTEKDAARLRHLRGLSDEIRNHLLVQPITVRFLLEKEETFAQDLHKRLRNVRPATKH